MQNEATTARQQLINKIAAQDTATIATSVLAIAGSDHTAETRMVHAYMIDELCNRFPEVDAAIEAWVTADDLDATLTMAEVAVAAIPMVAL